MSRTIHLTGLKQGIQRVREKGGADPDTLYDLEDGYVGIDGAIEQRPGTELAYDLPAGTLGMTAHDGDLVVFSTSPKACPTGTRCEVITHPFFPSQGLTYIWYAAPFLGYLYVVGEFENGDIYHYWLQAANEWEASTKYDEGQIIVPSTPNGLGYKAHRVLPKYPTWVPGMEVNLGDKIEPTVANGYYYEATETSEAAGVGTPGGSPNPSPPGDPPTDGGPATPTETPYGTPASTATGPNGGFPDDAPPQMNLPSVFEDDIIGAPGEFADAYALALWTQSTGDPLTGWSIDSGRAKYVGIQSINSTSYLLPVALRMPHLPFPRYDVTITADIQTLAGTYASIGFPGFASDPSEYLSATGVTFTYSYAQTYTTITIPQMLPTLTLSGTALLTGWFDNVTVEIVEVPASVTAETPDHIDFDSGLTGWTAYPPGDVDIFDLAVSGGEVSHSFLTTYADRRILYCDDPLTLADAIGKYIHVFGEVWCDDPSVSGGITTGGASFGVVVRNSTTGELIAPFSHFGQPERGDWTDRENWVRKHTDTAGLEFHVAVLLSAAPGYAVKVRNIGVEVTDSVVD